MHPKYEFNLPPPRGHHAPRRANSGAALDDTMSDEMSYNDSEGSLGFSSGTVNECDNVP